MRTARESDQEPKATPRANRYAPRKGRPTNAKRAKQGHIDTYDFKFDDELKRSLDMLNPMEVEKILLSKGFVRDYVNMDIRNKNLIKDVGVDNFKRQGILWFRYTHPQIPKILNSEWSVGVCLKTTLVENPSMSLSFVVFHSSLPYHLDMEEGFRVDVKAQDRTKLGLEQALINLFTKYQDLQKMIIAFTKKNKLTDESKKEVIQMFAKARLAKPFIDADDYKKSSVDFSEIEEAISSYPKSTRLIDFMGYCNHFILEGTKRIKYINGLDGHESAGSIKNVRRKLDLQKKLAVMMYQFIEKKTKQ